MEIIQSTLTTILSVLIQLCFIFLAGLGMYLLSKLGEYIGIKSDSNIMREIEQTILCIVKRENQKVVDKLKELSPDGKLTEEQQKEVYTEVYDNVVASLTKAQKEIVEKYFPTLEEGLEYIIEYMVNICHTSVIVTDSIAKDAIEEIATEEVTEAKEESEETDSKETEE